MAAASAAPTRIALRLTAVQSASGSERPWNGALPARSRRSVRSSSGAALIAKSVSHTTSSAVATSDTTPQTTGRWPCGGTPFSTTPGAKRVRSEHRRGERPATRREALQRQVSDVERVRASVKHLLDDELRGRGRVHESVTGEAGRDVQTRDARHGTHDRMVVR